MESDETFYLKATQETEGEDRNEALWAKSMTLAEGDEKKAKYNYINLRVEQLKSLSLGNETAAMSKSEVTKPISQEDTDFHKKYILVSEYAKLCNISYKTVRDSIDQGHLQGAVKDGEQYVRHLTVSGNNGNTAAAETKTIAKEYRVSESLVPHPKAPDLNAKLDVSIRNKTTEDALKNISETSSSSIGWLKKSFVKLFKLAIFLSILGGIGLAIAVYYDYKSKAEAENRKMELRKLISESELEFDHMRISKDDRNNFQVTGRIKNNSQHTLDELNLKIFVYDCLDAERKNCETVFVDEYNSIFADVLGLGPDEYVPPKQARDFKTYLLGSNKFDIQGNLAWNYQITYIQAK